MNEQGAAGRTRGDGATGAGGGAGGGSDGTGSNGTPGGADPPTARFDRGLTPMLAFVLLFGLVATVSIGILVAGGALLEESERSAETERVERGMVQVGDEIDAVAASDGGAGAVTLDLPDDGEGIVRRENTTRIVVTRYDGTRTEVVNRSVGSIVYRNDGTTYAYEAGAVWRGTGRGATALSAPGVSYRGATLTLPITDLAGEGRVDGDEFRVRHRSTRAPLSDVEMVRGDLITVRVTSAHYGGWADYFRDRIGAVSVTVDDANRTVVARLADPSIDGNFTTGLVASGDVHATNPSATVETEVATTGDVHGDVQCDAGSGSDCVRTVENSEFRPLNVAIELRAEAARNDDTATVGVPAGGDTLTAGTYYVTDDLYLENTDDLRVDLSGGDVTVVMEGNLGLKNAGIEVVGGAGTDHVARFYMNHTDVAMANQAGVAVEDDNASRLQIYGTNDTQFAMGQSNRDGFTGVVYAPRNEPANDPNDAVEDMDLNSAACSTDMCVGKGSGDVTGAIVGGDVTIAQNSAFSYDADLASIRPRMDRQGVFPPDVTYLHVSVRTVAIDDG